MEVVKGEAETSVGVRGGVGEVTGGRGVAAGKGGGCGAVEIKKRTSDGEKERKFEKLVFPAAPCFSLQPLQTKMDTKKPFSFSKLGR